MTLPGCTGTGAGVGCRATAGASNLTRVTRGRAAGRDQRAACAAMIGAAIFWHRVSAGMAKFAAIFLGPTHCSAGRPVMLST